MSSTRTRRIFIDSNIPMYVVGGKHPNQSAAQRLIADAAVAEHTLVTDAEVLQEILHRYVAIRRREAIDPAFALTLSIVDEVLPIERFDVERARILLQTTPRLSARDALHVAVMQRHSIDAVMSFDADLDGVPGITRLS
ncbi:MAG: type II toxin-antitoxin system VapC family toxin [Chloroflexota bacterium]